VVEYSANRDKFQVSFTVWYKDEMGAIDDLITMFAEGPLKDKPEEYILAILDQDT
jgi:hypothetical protein